MASTTQDKVVKMKRRAVIFVTLLAMTAFLVPTTQAADEKITGRVIAHFTKTETMEVGDVPGHVLGVGPVGDGKKFVIEGEFECVGGTGRYEGYKGTGTFKGERVGVIKDGGDAYYDFTMNCRKP